MVGRGGTETGTLVLGEAGGGELKCGQSFEGNTSEQEVDVDEETRAQSCVGGVV